MVAASVVSETAPLVMTCADADRVAASVVFSRLAIDSFEATTPDADNVAASRVPLNVLSVATDAEAASVALSVVSDSAAVTVTVDAMLPVLLAVVWASEPTLATLPTTKPEDAAVVLATVVMC
jgi:hypothetical protein